MTTPFYPIGKPGQPWSSTDKARWLSQQRIQRSYAEQVLTPLRAAFAVPALNAQARLTQYGLLDYAAYGLGAYPLYAVLPCTAQAGKPWLLLTGGVHGYETSGVQGALRFIAEKYVHYAAQANVVVLPCVSPWGYETINRWNPAALDPNRAFTAGNACGEAAAVMALLSTLPVPLAHIDLHETTDSDKTEFRPAKAARDGLFDFECSIPDGFYLVADAANPEPAFQAAMIDAVKKITFIAPPDAQGELIGEKMLQEGVIAYPKKGLALCGGATDARFITTTEVYPDSPRTTPENCIAAQLAAACAGFDFALANA